MASQSFGELPRNRQWPGFFVGLEEGVDGSRVVPMSRSTNGCDSGTHGTVLIPRICRILRFARQRRKVSLSISMPRASARCSAILMARRSGRSGQRDDLHGVRGESLDHSDARRGGIVVGVEDERRVGRGQEHGLGIGEREPRAEELLIRGQAI